MGYRHRVKHYLRDEQIYNFYIKGFVIGKKLHSPFRYDPGPSFYTKYTEEGFLIWIDYGIEQEYFDAIGFVSCLFRVGREGAARKIFEDIINKGIHPPFPELQVARELDDVIITQPLNDFELPYWEDYLISKSTLEFFNVYSLSGRYSKDRLVWKTEQDNPKYVYKFDEQSVKAKKIYSPLGRKKDKFRGFNNGDILEGYGQLPDNGDLLVVTSSLKDVMTLHVAGYNAVAPPSETNIVVLDKSKEELDSRFEKIIVLFDNDSAGQEFSLKLRSKYCWQSVFMQSHKDPSDYVKSTQSHDEIHKILNIFKN